MPIPIEQREQKIQDFEALRISVASPEEIMDWSYGEVTKPETINYRTQKPERDGLFCERIFGPTKDWECYCGKYKKIRYKGVICDKCGVEVTKSSVRRERMGHIDLAVPIAHIWYIHGVPSILGLILDMSLTDLEKVIYFAAYVILEVNQEVKAQALAQLEKEYLERKKQSANQSPIIQQVEAVYRQAKSEIESLKVKQSITETKYHDLSLRYGQIIRVGIGAEAVFELLERIDLELELKTIAESLEKSIGANRRKLLKQMRVLADMKRANIKPQWLILKSLPVIPPDLRPMVQLDGGRFAASDLNDLYRRIINRNNRLKRLINQGAPEVICRNEKRMLQEAVDALIDNQARRGKVASVGAQRALRSLSDMLRGKQGRFRQNLLGKRVDYSGRSVIVIGPELKLHQCGIPKVMALELFKPFVISKLISEGFVHNVKNATRLIEKGTPEVWDILERITSQSFVMLNRAPTLHRLGIQAFQPVLIEGKAIQIHPLVCYAFNADFDGDQMAVHVPLSKQACDEASRLMRSSFNLLKPASGDPVVQARYDIVFGCYYLTSFQENDKGEGKIFANKNEAILAYQQGVVHFRSKIKLPLSGVKVTDTEPIDPEKEKQLFTTTVGRILFNNILPEEFQFLNTSMGDKTLKKLVKDIFQSQGLGQTAQFVDRMKDIGFEYATLSGLTISMSDVVTPPNKSDLISLGDQNLERIETEYRRGLINDEERRVKTIELWINIRSQIEKEMINAYNPNNPIYLMVVSGARGSFAQVTQLGGMKGLVVNPAGDIIELPIKASFKEGLSVFEYFISTHGARKGKSDTSLRTSDAGYLTRRLVDVAQDMVISAFDCGTKKGMVINRVQVELYNEKFIDKLIGRISLNNIINPKTKKTIVAKGEEINEEKANLIDQSNIEEIEVRSVLYCQNEWGICQQCYGRNLARGEMVEIGEAVGIIAAQAIGEPGTQLTMKTFHLGGVTGEDITTGLPRVEELFEARPPRFPAVMAEIDGIVDLKEEKDRRVLSIIADQYQQEKFDILKDYEVIVKKNDLVKPRQPIMVAENKKAIRSSILGLVSIKDDQVTITSKERVRKDYFLLANIIVKVKPGDQVTVGQELTEGHLDLSEAIKLKGELNTQKYIIRGIQEIYTSQGQTINDKHLEVIIKRMFSKIKIKDGMDTDLIVGQIIDSNEVQKLIEGFEKQGKKIPKYEPIVMGITRVALKTDSFLSAASFQETTGILIEAAVRGAIDRLKGLKENVIIGKLIPAGTGLRKDFIKDQKEY